MIMSMRLVMHFVDMSGRVRNCVGSVRFSMRNAMRITNLWLAARVPSRRAIDRDQSRDDRAEKRQEDDRRIHAASLSSC
jgi:hypothetical protein